MSATEESGTRFFSLFSQARSEAVAEIESARAKAIAAETIRKQAADMAESDARLAAELDAALAAEDARIAEERRKVEAEDSKFASRVLEEEKVLIERQAGQEAADKELAKKMQRKHMKPLREATEALIKIWREPKVVTVEQETGVQLSCKLPYVKSVCVDTLPDFAGFNVCVVPDFTAICKFANELPTDMLPYPMSMKLDVRILGPVQTLTVDDIRTSYDASTQTVTVFVAKAKINKEAEQPFFRRLAGSIFGKAE